MKSKYILALSLVISISSISYQSVGYPNPTEISLEDLDALQDLAEQSHTFDTISVPEQSAFIVALCKIDAFSARIMGSPLSVTLLNFRKRFCNSWDWVMDTTAGPTCKKCNTRH